MTNAKRAIVVMGMRSPKAIGDVKTILKNVDTVSKDLGLVLQLVNASRVYGKEHLEVAAEHALRAFDEGRNFGKTVAIEVLMYASGKRQISEALKFMGLGHGMIKIGVVAISGPGKTVPADLRKRLGFERDDSVLSGSEDVLDAFGIGPEIRKGTSPEKWADLIIEKVTLLELEK